MPLVSVSAHDIDTAGRTLAADLPPAWLDEELREASVTSALPGRVEARLSRTGDAIVVRGRVRASLTTPCARCTDPTSIDVDTELSLLLEPAPKAATTGKGAARSARPKEAKEARDKDPGHASDKPKDRPKGKTKEDEEYEFTSAEADLDTYDGETVVLDPFIREAILLEVPNFPLCSEACPGIRPAAATAPEPAAPTLDPRLAPLGALRARLASSKREPDPEPAGPAAKTAGAKTKKKKE